MLASLDHLVLTVADVDRTAAFYRDVLGMVPQPFSVADGSTRMALTFGTQKINLHPADSPYRPHARLPLPGTADLCFLAAIPLSVCIVRIEAQGVAIVEGPVARMGAAGPILSIYLRDPDGNLIEVSQPR